MKEFKKKHNENGPSQLKRKELELASVCRIDDIRDATTDMRYFFQLLVRELKKIFQCKTGALFYKDEITKKIEISVISSQKKVDTKALEKVAWQSMLKKKMIKNPGVRGLGHSICLPVVFHNRSNGSIILGDRKKGFTGEDISLLELLESQIDSALEHKIVIRRLEQRNNELTVLYRIDRIRDTIGNFEIMLNQILTEILKVVPARTGFIMVYNERKKRLELKAVNRLKVNRSFLKIIAQEAIDQAELVKTDKYITLPLLLKNRVIGVFGVIDSPKGKFDIYDERLLRAIGSQADTAIFEDLSRQKIKDIFKRYVAEDVVEKMLKEDKDFLKGSKENLSVLFCDMRGFTSMSEKIGDPEKLVIIINEYLGTMASAVLNNKGTLDKFVGDEVMAIFGAPMPNRDHARIAVQTAIDMQKAMKSLNKKWAKEKKPTNSVGIGINSGDMIVGNIGCEIMTDYTVMGDKVNLASRLCGAAAPGQILVTEYTFKKSNKYFRFKKLSPIKVKGKSRPVDIYEVCY
ncbi:MAG: hypothetical protein JW827_00805 [Spirochaetes bacterium]|nr:hypothetical protein [Spirochaetota bacterium]